MQAFIYLAPLQGAEIFKIGVANCVQTRMRTIGLEPSQTTGIQALRFETKQKAVQMEAVLHKVFADARLPAAAAMARGAPDDGATEWFAEECRARLFDFLDAAAPSMCFEHLTSDEVDALRNKPSAQMPARSGSMPSLNLLAAAVDIRLDLFRREIRIPINSLCAALSGDKPLDLGARRAVQDYLRLWDERIPGWFIDGAGSGDLLNAAVWANLGDDRPTTAPELSALIKGNMRKLQRGFQAAARP